MPEAVKLTSSARAPSSEATTSRALSSSSRASRPGAVQPQRVGEPAVEGGEQGLAGGRMQRLGGDRVEVGRARPGRSGAPVAICHTAETTADLPADTPVPQ